MGLIRRHVVLSAIVGLLVLGGSVAAVSAQTGGGGEPAIDKPGGPSWEQDGFECLPDPADPEDHGGPPWVCGGGAAKFEGLSGPPGLAGKPGPTAGHPGPQFEGHPGRGEGPAWTREDFACGTSDDGGRGGPPWVCSDPSTSALHGASGAKGPAWLR